jgi:hypothetical protein
MERMYIVHRISRVSRVCMLCTYLHALTFDLCVCYVWSWWYVWVVSGFHPTYDSPCSLCTIPWMWKNNLADLLALYTVKIISIMVPLHSAKTLLSIVQEWLIIHSTLEYPITCCAANNQEGQRGEANTNVGCWFKQEEFILVATRLNLLLDYLLPFILSLCVIHL